jgi:peroxiredoxin Q/BCP
MRFRITATFAALALGPVACSTQPAPAPVPVAPTAASLASAAPVASAQSAPAASTAAASTAAASTAAATPPSLATGDDDLVGKPAPDFTAPASDGTTFHLAAVKGKLVVVYFYPKDETPGCTKEACSFRDAWTALAKTGAVLVGISADSAESHKAFISHWKLPFSLITDADGTIGRTFGVPFERHHSRQTVIIGADGVVKKVYRKVDVAVHTSQVLEDLARASHPS